YAQYRRRRLAAVELVCFQQRLLRFRLQERVPGPSLSRRLSARTHHLRSVARQRLRRATLRLAECPERRQPPHRTRQQPDLRRLPLEQPARNLCRTAVPVPLLRGRRLGWRSVDSNSEGGRIFLRPKT